MAPAAAAGATTYTLPAADGANGQVLTTNASATLSWSTPAVYPVSASLLFDEATVLTGDFAIGTDVLQALGTYVINDPTPADGDSFQQHFFLKAGTYTLWMNGITYTNRGKIDWYIDGALVTTGQDWYSAGIAYNVIKSVSVTVVGNGDHILKAVVNGKNASSSAYYYLLTKAWLN